MDYKIKRQQGREVLKIRVYENKDASTLPVLKFPALEAIDCIEHCVSTRYGGASKGIFSSVNVSFNRGDEKEAVMENYQRLGQVFAKEAKDFVTTKQTHTTNLRVVTQAEAGIGVTRPQDMDDIDGMLTNVPGLVLTAMFADCVPLFFVDPYHRAIALSHSGWRGTVARMGQVTVEKMQEVYGSKPADIICAIGPSICQECYEVSEDVAEAFKAEFPTHEDEIMYYKGKGKYQLDLWKANEIVLLEAGIEKAHISMTDICTCCNPELLFSHRASKGRRGNIGAFLMLK